MISKETLSLIRERTDIVALVSERVPSLKKKGWRYIGLCPFHSDKKGEFRVNAEAGIYHCMGCRRAGDAFGFLTAFKGVTFRQAVRALAKRAGVSVIDKPPEIRWILR